MKFFIRMSYTIEILMGSLVFLQALPRKNHFILRFVAGILLSLVTGYWLSFFRSIGQLGNLISLQFTIIFIILSMHLVFDGPFSATLSACIAGVAAQHIGHQFSLLIAELPNISHWSNILEFFCVNTVYLVLYILLGKKLRQQQYYNCTSSQSTVVSLVIVLICTGINRLLHVDRQMSLYVVIGTSLYAITCCILALFLQFFLYYNIRSKNEHQLFLRLYDEERRQYEFSKENADILSVKYHDLKHKLVALQDHLPQREIDSMRNIIETYDNVYHTDNEVLDIILNEKILHSRGKGITITCMGSGAELLFLDPMDVYSLFGNLLENAINEVEKLENLKQRIISLVIQQKENLVYIDVMNFCQETSLIFEDGLPKTTKHKETGFHGYGLKSVRAIAHKYNGNLSITQKNGIFTAQIYLMRNEL